MPELPEVETSRRGIAPHIEGQVIQGVVVRQPKLRWPIPRGLNKKLTGQTLHRVKRRAKYLLLEMDSGHLIIHLGMSGSLRILPCHTPPETHDHFDLLMDGCCLRLRDPRRFGAVLWTSQPPEQHRLLKTLGPEPLSDALTGEYLYQQSRNKKVAVKNFIMNSHVTVGVGNIYASESLFMTGIHPERSASRISLKRYRALSQSIKTVLTKAIKRGGTTLKDFQREDGKPGYFAQQLNVYGREGEPCPTCNTPISQKRIGQRSSFYCRHCQT